MGADGFWFLVIGGLLLATGGEALDSEQVHAGQVAIGAGSLIFALGVLSVLGDIVKSWKKKS